MDSDFQGGIYMKKNITYILILIFTIGCLASCSFYKEVMNSSNIVKKIECSSKENLNLMLTSMPIFVNNEAVYYVDAGKTLIKKEDDYLLTIDVCEESELIQDIYVYNEDIYYAKQSEQQIDIMKFNEGDTQNLLTIPHSSYTFGEDFIYKIQNMFYYYNSYDNVLYLINDSGIQECINGITAVSMDEYNIYYADVNGSIYVCNKELTDSKEIWSIQRISDIKDEFLDAWCDMNINEYTNIACMSINDNTLLFTICANSQTRNGILFSIQLNNGEVSFSKEFAVDNYQLFDNNIYISGYYISDKQINDGIFKYNPRNGEIMNLGINKNNMYINGHDGYFWDDELNCRKLKKINLLTHEIKAID